MDQNTFKRNNGQELPEISNSHQATDPRSQRASSRINTNTHTHIHTHMQTTRHILFKILKTKGKEKILKAVIGKKKDILHTEEK